MEGCNECKEITTVYDTLCKTYYKLEDGSILCYRHWYQKDRPKFIIKGDYDNIFCKNTNMRKYEKSKTF